jgi:hypothetical protein
MPTRSAMRRTSCGGWESTGEGWFGEEIGWRWRSAMTFVAMMFVVEAWLLSIAKEEMGLFKRSDTIEEEEKVWIE